MQLNIFCTLFDSFYLSRGLSMIHSLKRVCKEFHLYVFAFDDTCYEILNGLLLDSVTVVPLSHFEDEELLKIKPTRSRAEYCWTCTPSVILYCLKKYRLPICTYIDADLFFYSDPNVLFEEMGANSVMITEHRYTPKYDQTQIAGKYCVQFVTVRNDEAGLKVLEWWREACNQWCYARYEDGKFGDQKYLDDWTTRFNGVWEMKHLGAGVAPWNLQQYDFFRKGEDIWLREKKSDLEYPLIFFHFHYLKFYQNDVIELSVYETSWEVIELIYKDYIADLEKRKTELLSINPNVNYHAQTDRPIGFWELLRTVNKIIKRKYNIYKKNRLLRN